MHDLSLISSLSHPMMGQKMAFVRHSFDKTQRGTEAGMGPLSSVDVEWEQGRLPPGRALSLAHLNSSLTLCRSITNSVPASCSVPHKKKSQVDKRTHNWDTWEVGPVDEGSGAGTQQACSECALDLTSEAAL